MVAKQAENEVEKKNFTTQLKIEVDCKWFQLLTDDNLSEIIKPIIGARGKPIISRDILNKVQSICVVKSHEVLYYYFCHWSPMGITHY